MLDKLLILLFVCYLSKINNICANTYICLLLIIYVCVCVLFEKRALFCFAATGGKISVLVLYLFTQPTLNSVLTLQMKIVLTSLTRFIVSFSTQLTYIQAHLCIGINVNECICMHVFTEINVHKYLHIHLFINHQWTTPCTHIHTRIHSTLFKYFHTTNIQMRNTYIYIYIP